MNNKKLVGTVEKTATYNILQGNKLYQKRARQTFPLLVRQANAEQPIFYSDLAQEIEISNPRNLNYVLGAIGNSLIELGEKWKEKIPPIQCLVINKYTGIPGEGFEDFLPDKNSFRKSGRKRKKAIIREMLSTVFHYSKWDNVLFEFNLTPVETQWIKFSPPKSYSKYGSEGESKEHKALKKYIAEHPNSIGLSEKVGKGEIEFVFPSADIIDVLFAIDGEWIGVEVKSKNSNIDDIARGIYQCVKYQALIEAMQMVHQKRLKAKTILVLESKFPKSLYGLKNILGINIIDEIIISK